MATASVTAEFQQEFEAERTAWFRKRFLWYTGVFGVISLLSVFGAALMLLALPESMKPKYTWMIILGMASSLLYPAAFIYVRQATSGLSRRKMIRLTFWLILIHAVMGIPGALVGNEFGVAGARMGAVIGATQKRIDTIRASVSTPDPQPDDQPADTAEPAPDPPPTNDPATPAPAPLPSPTDAPTTQAPTAESTPAQPEPQPEPQPESQPEPQPGQRPVLRIAGIPIADLTDATPKSSAQTDELLTPEQREEITRLQRLRDRVRREGIPNEAAFNAILAELDAETAQRITTRLGGRGGPTLGPGAAWFLNVMIAHFLAALFIPWTWRECIIALLPMVLINAAGTAIGGELFTPAGIAFVLLAPLLGLPGVLVVAIRNSLFRKKFTYQMLRGRYTEMKRELGLARQIHEDLFPDPITNGPLRLAYHYEPMRQIGGDYLHARSVLPPGKPEPRLHLCVMDVTGHGIGAALTVNRLHGEMDRMLAENPDITPGQLLTGLNRYMHATLAGHSVYATALCLSVDLADSELRWASAGHPPAFLRQVNGRIEELHSTTFVLGVTYGDDFVHDEQRTPFRPGDTLLAYTDGAIESRNARNRMLGVAGLLAMFSSGQPDPRGGWPAALAERVQQYRVGPSQDDILLVELSRPLG